MITVCPPDLSRQRDFLAFTRRNRDFHQPWTSAPSSQDEFAAYGRKYRGEENISFWVLSDSAIAGVINLNHIIRGKFQNAFLGYYGSKDFSGTGVMMAGMAQVLQTSFNALALHRLECAIQPENHASLSFIRKLSFQFEGYARDYLLIDHVWRDHLKFSLTKTQWQSEKPSSRAVRLSEYQERWAVQFDAIRPRIEAIIGTATVEHIGSTAVVGLAAKPLIDIQLQVEGFDEVAHWRDAIERLGLDLVDEFTQDHIPFMAPGRKDRAWAKRFFRGAVDGIGVNLHVRLKGSPNGRFALLVRDFLRANPLARTAYEQVKRRLCEAGIASEAYAYTKDPVCDLIFLEAESWAKRTQWNEGSA